jgi:hypothetical protein
MPLLKVDADKLPAKEIKASPNFMPEVEEAPKPVKKKAAKKKAQTEE